LELGLASLGGNRRNGSRAEDNLTSRLDPQRSSTNQTAVISVVSKLDHIYDLRRDCLLNELYYAHRLSVFSRINLWLELVIVIGSGASGISGWVIWTTYPQLKMVWAVIAAAATLLTALKPALHIDAKIKRYSMLFINYRQLSVSMDSVVQEISEVRGLTSQIERDSSRARARYRNLAAEDDPKPSTELVLKLQSEVGRRIPVDSLFYPVNLDNFPRSGGSNDSVQAPEAAPIRTDPTGPRSSPEEDYGGE
jgi:hypothetical protein